MNAKDLHRLTGQEVKQREEEGCGAKAIAGAREKHKAAGLLADAEKRAACEKILMELAELAPEHNYVEPSDLEGIRAERPDGPRLMQNRFSVADLFERTSGGWLGRCTGCLLGKPVEGAMRPVIKEAAESDGNWPLCNYFAPVTFAVGGKRRLRPGNPSLRGHIDGMARDDDIDYTITGLLLLERHGFDFTTDNVASFWLRELPFEKVYTAERIAYRNLVDGIPPSEAAEHLNPCRECIGAQIRADAFGYACPGRPELAAELGYRDARLSHRKNGIYGEMLVCAMIAAAYVERDVAKIIEIGLSEIPARSRLSEAARNVVAWWKESGDWEGVAGHIDEHYGALQGCHTITNAAIVILGLLAGASDFTAGLAASVMPGYDTDCNGATVGSILGVRCGASGIPGHWKEPLRDKVTTIIASVHEARISDLARRTVDVAVADLAKAAASEPFEPMTWGVGG